jgi:histidine triad (HIT) family protein
MTICVFCKIVAGEIPGQIVYKDDLVTGFKDIHPAAPTHILIVPNIHIASTNDITEKDEALLGHMLLTAKKVAADQGISENGYRLIINTGKDANQLVQHLHLHLLGGHLMRHPMG